MLCFVVKHLGSRRALKKWGKTLDYVSCSPLHFFRALPLPACFRVLYKCDTTRMVGRLINSITAHTSLLKTHVIFNNEYSKQYHA